MYILEISDNEIRKNTLLFIINSIFQKRFKNIEDAFIIEGFKYIESSLKTKTNKISIEDIRILKESIFLNLADEDIKLTIINNAHNLTVEAQNSLLKILEEEPKNSIIIMALEDRRHVLPTINSRGIYLRYRDISLIHPSISNEKTPDLWYNKESNKLKEIEEFLNKDFLNQLVYIKKLTEKKNKRSKSIEKPSKTEEKEDTVESFLKNLLLYQEKFLYLDSDRFVQNIKLIEECIKKVNKNVNERAILEYLILRMNNGNNSR